MTDFSAHPYEQAATASAGDQQDAVVAGLAGGGYVVAWSSIGAGGVASVSAQLYDAQGHRSGGEIPIFVGSGSTLTAWSGYRVGGIAGLPDGSFVVSAWAQWTDASGGHASALYALRMDASGHMLAAPALVASGNDDAWVEAGPVLALPGGAYAVVEQKITHPLPYPQVDAVVHAFTASNAPAGTPVIASGWAPSNYDVAALGNGNYVSASLSVGSGPTQLTWTVSDAAGATLATASLPGAAGITQYADPTVVALANGDALVAWQLAQYDAASGALMSRSWQAQRIDASGHALGGVFNLSLDASAGTALHFTALAGGGFLATWPQTPFPKTGEVELLGQAFDESGHAAGALVQFNAVPNVDWTYHLPYAVAATTDGGFVLAAEWAGASGLDVHEQKFDVAAPGTPGPYIAAPGGSVTAIGAGNFRIGGTGDLAQVAVASSHTAWTFSPDDQGIVMTGPEGTDVLVNVNRVRFGDGTAIAFDVTGHAGQAYRLYQAAFDRAPDAAGLGFHIQDLDAGLPLWGAAQHFVDSPEFQSKYGTPDATQFITLLYEHVLHREPEAAGLQFHLGEFAQGETRADMLTHFSESAENQANVIGQVGGGMWFVPAG